MDQQENPSGEMDLIPFNYFYIACSPWDYEI